jgi:hypothetical protein
MGPIIATSTRTATMFRAVFLVHVNLVTVETVPLLAQMLTNALPTTAVVIAMLLAVMQVRRGSLPTVPVIVVISAMG